MFSMEDTSEDHHNFCSVAVCPNSHAPRDTLPDIRKLTACHDPISVQYTHQAISQISVPGYNNLYTLSPLYPILDICSVYHYRNN